MLRLTVLLAVVALYATFASAQRANRYQVESADGATVLSVEVGDRVTYSVARRGRSVLDASPISLTRNMLSDARILGRQDRVRSDDTRGAGYVAILRPTR